MAADACARPIDRDVDPRVWTQDHLNVIKAAAEDPQVQRIFVNAAIKKALCRDARGDRAWLHTVRPYWGHDYHFHIRLVCPPGQPECREQDAVPPGDGCDAASLALLVLRCRAASKAGAGASPAPADDGATAGRMQGGPERQIAGAPWPGAGSLARGAISPASGASPAGSGLIVDVVHFRSVMDADASPGNDRRVIPTSSRFGRQATVDGGGGRARRRRQGSPAQRQPRKSSITQIDSNM